MTLTIPDDVWTQYADACRANRGFQVRTQAVRNPDNSIKSAEVLETPDQLGKRVLAEFMQTEIRGGERKKAQDAANAQLASIQVVADANVPPASAIIT